MNCWGRASVEDLQLEFILIKWSAKRNLCFAVRCDKTAGEYRIEEIDYA